METSTEVLQGLKDRFSAVYTAPPFTVLHGLAAAIGERTIAQSVANYKVTATPREANSPQSEIATWECMALADGCLVTVTATRPGGEWYHGSLDADERRSDANVRASVISLDEVAVCRLVDLHSLSETMWLSRWEFVLRTGDTLSIPWSKKDRNIQDSHEALARAVTERLR